jgi:hypothetical protein
LLEWEKSAAGLGSGAGSIYVQDIDFVLRDFKISQFKRLLGKRQCNVGSSSENIDEFSQPKPGTAMTCRGRKSSRHDRQRSKKISSFFVILLNSADSSCPNMIVLACYLLLFALAIALSYSEQMYLFK